MEMNRIKISGYAVLFIGVALLLFTFAMAYQFLSSVTEIGASPDLMDLFGEALTPLIMYAIRALFLGIMGWIGSILTRRGIQTLTIAPREGGKRPDAEPKPKAEAL
jgi:hypothetical protein